MIGLDLAREVTCAEPYRLAARGPAPAPAERPFRVVAYDFGMKRNIVRSLAARRAATSRWCRPRRRRAEALALEPDGIFLSNGPGDPEPCTYAIEAAKALMEKLPVFGICLGHQILGLACGGKTYKLKFGHRGANHPGEEPGHRPRRDHVPEPRLLRWTGPFSRSPSSC